jgi:predicted  nucleic acid-binding Zn-ribbon protein
LEKAEADVSSQIPGDILKIYRDLRRTKGKRAVVPVQGQTCTGCWTESPLSLLKRSRPDELLFCDNCGRVLLLEE